MEATSIAFDAARSVAPTRPVSLATSVVGNLAPRVSIPLRFILIGLTALCVGVAFLGLRPDVLATYHYNQYVIAVTHVFTLGWISSVIMGAMYQLVPVALETKLHSERLARGQFVLHVIGVSGLVWMLWLWNMKQAGHFGSLVGCGIGLFVYNLGRTLARIPRWNVIATGIASALCWLTLTMFAGLYVAAAKCWSFSPFEPIAQMHAHAHLGVLGFFVTMLVTISFKLVPMFTLSELQSPRRAGLAIGLLNAGLLGLATAILLHSRWKLAFAGVVTLALSLYGWEITAVLRARKRRSLDWSLRYFLTALALLVPLVVLGITLALPRLPINEFTGQLENAYGLLALLGVLTLAILGMLYKIVPFLVWYARYSRDIGRNKVPALAEMYSPGVQVAGFWTFLSGLGVLTVATVCAHEKAIQAGAVLIGLSLGLFILNMARILSHLLVTKTQPRHLQPATQANR